MKRQIVLLVIFSIIFIIPVNGKNIKTGVMISFPINSTYIKFGSEIEKYNNKFTEKSIKIFSVSKNIIELAIFYQEIVVNNLETEKARVNIKDKIIGFETGKVFSGDLFKIGKSRIGFEVSLGIYGAINIKRNEEVLEEYEGVDPETSENASNMKYRVGLYATTRLRVNIGKADVFAGIGVFNPFLGTEYSMSNVKYERYHTNIFVGVGL